MKTQPLVIISTRLPPQVCGVGTYSWELQKHWPDQQRPVEFLVMDVAPDSDRSHGINVFGGSATELRMALDRIGSADAVLHYAGRAYQRFGCPTWLPGVLRDWKRKFAAARLLVFFHELPGSDFKVTSPHYWLGRLSALIVRRLASFADVLVTNTSEHAAMLRRFSRRTDVHIIPVASNILPASAAAAGERAATEFVVFGLSFGRLQAVQRFHAEVPRWHSSGKLTKLHVIGPQDDGFSAEADQLMRAWPASIEIARHGMLPAAEVSQLLSRARFALSNANAETWSKSGSFMACAAHGCAVVMGSGHSGSPPLSYTVDGAEVESISDAEVERRAAALLAWAAQNASWPVIATRIASLLEADGLSNGK